MNTVSIIGGTGLIGAKLALYLHEMGDKVFVLSRSGVNYSAKPGGIEFRQCDPERHIWPHKELSMSDVVVNLAGRSIDDKRLTQAYKEEVYNSRIAVTKNLVTYLNGMNNICNLLVNASAIGIYGYDRGEERLNEDADPGIGFMADLCQAWEMESRQFEGGRLVNLRTGIVLAKAGGAYKSLKTPILLGLGSALGSGRQWVPWIHIDDMVRAIYHVINTKIVNGPVNICSTNCVRNSRLVGSIADSLNKPIIMPRVPGTILRLVLGEFAQSILGSLQVVPSKLQESGFSWNYPQIDQAVKQLNWGK